MTEEEIKGKIADLVEKKAAGPKKEVRSDEMMNIRWNSQFGHVYVDGSHMKVCYFININLSLFCRDNPYIY